jgi:hypothetical protein
MLARVDVADRSGSSKLFLTPCVFPDVDGTESLRLASHVRHYIPLLGSFNVAPSKAQVDNTPSAVAALATLLPSTRVQT